MYLLAKSISKVYEPASKYLLGVFNTYNTEKLSTTNQKHMVKVCNCMIYNLTKSVLYGTGSISICLSKHRFYGDTIVNGRKSLSKPINYNCFKLFVKVMIEAGCEVDKGGFSGYDEIGDKVFKSTIFTLSDEIFNNLFILLQKAPLPQLESVLELRDENKKPKTFQSVKETQKMISNLKAYNNLSETFDIRDGSGQRLFVSNTRVFNLDFQNGGRFYTTGGAVQSMPSEERKRITIDGEEVTECDFTAMHLSILATECGYEFDEDFDPYGIVIKGYEPKLLRKLAKMSILIRLNCENEPLYCMAFSRWIGKNLDIKELYRNKSIPKILIDPRDILYAVMEHNPYLIEKMSIHDCIGKRLQCVDGSIAEIVLNYFTQQYKCVLCMHDSFITKKKDQSELLETMRWAYKERLGDDTNCVIDVKY